MNTSTTASISANADSVKAKAAELDASLPETHRAVLLRIATQRERLNARRNARAQALALQSQQSAHMPTSGPLSERLVAFARLHPLAVAAAAGVALVIGPRRLIRWSSVILPLVMKYRR
ncbi:hypothetical protein [Pantoea sp. 18069]|uniref:hypothetical protein n=1 Tax=Pantoea sp. 18069 TaxID=2681415 RepID=UPI00190FBF58|nr:hypothetical protein [Pantoea sp. 18069]